MSGGSQQSRPGIPFVVSGPSGVGKTSILRRVLQEDDGVAFSVSHTTRPPRAGEVNGDDYWFVNEAEFRAMIERDAFLEWAPYQGNLYGTSSESIEGPTREGIDLILEVEVQGARQLREKLKPAVTVFVLPPSSLTELEERLRRRRSDDEQAIRKRLETASQEILEAKYYRYVIINQELDLAVADLLKIIRAARLEQERVLPGWRSRFEAE